VASDRIGHNNAPWSTKYIMYPAPIITGMNDLETAWAVLNDALGIGKPIEPMTVAAVFCILGLAILAGCAAGRLALWLPDGIRMLLLLLWEVFEALLRRLFGRAEKEGERKPRKREIAELYRPSWEKPPSSYAKPGTRIEVEEREEIEAEEDEEEIARFRIADGECRQWMRLVGAREEFPLERVKVVVEVFLKLDDIFLFRFARACAKVGIVEVVVVADFGEEISVGFQ